MTMNISFIFLMLWAILINTDVAVGFKLPCTKSVFKCGSPAVQPDSTSRIVGGHPARRGAWPWMVLLVVDEYLVCGGTIISDHFVLTASHCFSDRTNDTSKWKVIAGKQRLDRYEDEQQTVGVSRIIWHEHFNSTTLENDIALVRLAEPVSFSTLIQPICLPDADKGVYPGDMCLMAGWGDTKGTGDRTTLNQVTLPVIADEVCASIEWYGDLFIGKSTFCAGYEEGGKDACTGDSGGPLICKEGKIWVVQGIASWGIECAIYRWPGIYTEVTKFVTWIQETMNRESQDICQIMGQIVG